MGTLIELHVDMPEPVWCGAEVVRHGLSTPSIPYPLAARFLLTRRAQGQKPISGRMAIDEHEDSAQV